MLREGAAGRRLVALSAAGGAFTLALEAAWAEQLRLALGSGAWAQALVLAAVLAGLAFGALRFGRLADASGRPLELLSYLLGAAAAAGALSVPVFRALEPIPPGWLWLSAALGSLLVAAPCALLGGLLPCLVRASSAAAPGSSPRLYAWNAAGSAAGALLSGFALLPALGLDGAVLAASAGVALCAWAARRVSFSVEAPAERPERPDAPVPESLALSALFATGFASLSGEIAWTRLLALVMGSSTYAFCVMLAGFIAGGALGAFAARRLLDRGLAPALGAGLAWGSGALALLAAIPFYERLPYSFQWLGGVVPRTEAGFWLFSAAQLAFCALAMLPATLFSGAALACAFALPAPAGRRASAFGARLAASTAGNVLGALGGLLLMPALGVEGLLRSGALVGVAAGCGMLAWGVGHRAWAGALAAAALALDVLPARWEPLLLHQGEYRTRRPPTERWAGFRKSMLGDRRLLFHRDAPEASVVVLASPAVEGAEERHPDAPPADPWTKTLNINGKPDASTGGDMATQVLLGQLPLHLRPDAREVLVIGWGSGVTVGSVLRHPVEKVHAAEISRAVVEASEHFRAAAGPTLEDPRLALHVEDARRTLKRPLGPFDVIISEPSNPWMAGVASLFTVEFYRRAAARLRPGGIMVQWCHLYEMDDETFRLIVRSFGAVFPHVTVWVVRETDALLVGSFEPLAADAAAVERAFARPGVAEDLRRAGVASVAALLVHEVAGPATARELMGRGALNRERRPLLEHRAPRAYFTGRFAELLAGRHDALLEERRGSLLLARYLEDRGRGLASAEYEELARLPQGGDEAPLVRHWVREWTERHPRDPRAWASRYLFGSQNGDGADAEAALKRLRALPGGAALARQVEGFAETR